VKGFLKVVRKMCEYESFSDTPFYKRQTRILAPYAQTPDDVAREMLKLAKAKPNELMVDLGCGDGSVLVIAASEFGCRCIGYEIDDILVRMALSKIEELKLNNRVKVVHDDLFNADLSKADIVFLYLTPEMLKALKKKLELELKRGARVVSHDYPIEEWRPLVIRKAKGNKLHTHVIFLYVKE